MNLLHEVVLQSLLHNYKCAIPLDEVIMKPCGGSPNRSVASSVVLKQGPRTYSVASYESQMVKMDSD